MLIEFGALLGAVFFASLAAKIDFSTNPGAGNGERFLPFILVVLVGAPVLGAVWGVSLAGLIGLVLNSEMVKIFQQ